MSGEESGGNHTAAKLAVVVVAVAVIGVLIALYVGLWATDVPKTVAATPSTSPLGPTTHLTLQTDAAVGPQMSPSHPDWVGYLVRRGGKWERSTIYQVPAHSLVHVTIYQFDGDTLKIAHGEADDPRPTAFTSKEGSSVSVMVLKRKK